MAGKLNLDILVSHLVDVHAYVGVVEIALASAQKRDPQVTTDNQTHQIASQYDAPCYIYFELVS